MKLNIILIIDFNSTLFQFFIGSPSRMVSGHVSQKCHVKEDCNPASCIDGGIMICFQQVCTCVWWDHKEGQKNTMIV